MTENINPSSILIINVSRIGDTLLATPAIRAIAAAYPEANVDVFGHPNRAEVLGNLPFIRNVGIIDKKRAPFRGRLNLITGPQYDLAFIYGFDQPLITYALRVARKVVAFRQTDERINSRLYRVVAPPDFKSDHAVNLALKLPQSLGILPKGLRLAYAVTPEELTWARARIAHDIPDDAWPKVGLQIASFPTKSYRDWPLESFIDLCQRIQSRWPRAHYLIFGGREEKLRTNALKERLALNATHYAGSLSLRETGALMSQLDIYIGVDTGPTHMMSTFDIPMVALYHGFSDSHLIGPLNHPKCFAIDHPDSGPNCPIDADMADITVDRVFESVAAALSDAK